MSQPPCDTDMLITMFMKSLPSITTYYSYCYVRRRDSNPQSVILVHILISGLNSLIMGNYILKIIRGVIIVYWIG